ncbi:MULTISPECIES: FxDxF family PEP-CTERM protein [Janthinobacterium]|uniref:FxDxF family PEP-CTERM protein n=1 Tax=Janthinobacterium TaxID=29580 RepID=UPI000C0D557D|nr:FxDxF family PEP-CTERM protein [Janthinobacterium sp. BJB401]NVI80545.1 PEP-CTERM sorting domain-containing protein [Janthinobacterium sp. BJB401]PHV34114.1 PEP-CTERM sorting domain-containing protein [Janthinobacterium sp. BJB312]
MKLKSLIAVALLSAASIGVAQATAYNVDLSNTTGNLWTGGFNATPNPLGEFTDTFTFTPDATFGSTAQAFLANLSVTGSDAASINFSGADLNGIALTGFGGPTVFGYAQGEVLAQTSLLFNGPMVLTVMGNSNGGSYGGTFNLNLAPVPEPETYGMLLAGLGVLGFLARRRKQS